MPRRCAPGARNTGAFVLTQRSYIWCGSAARSPARRGTPAVVRRPVLAPLRSSTALVATVVPCPKPDDSAGSKAPVSAARRIAFLIATPGAARVVGTFMCASGRPSPTHTTSVKVPPTSTPMLIGAAARPPDPCPCWRSIKPPNRAVKVYLYKVCAKPASLSRQGVQIIGEAKSPCI